MPIASPSVPFLRLSTFVIALIGSTSALYLFDSNTAIAATRFAGEPGSVISTPPNMTYYATEGDTLSTIAKRFTEKTQNWMVIGKVNHISNDRTIPVGSAILIPLELLPEDPSEAKVFAMAGVSTAKIGSSTEETIALGKVFTEGTLITTGKNGFLTLALPDDSRISIPSNSQVRLSKLRMTKYTKSPRTEITLLQGRVESKVTPLESNKGRFEVRSPLAVAGVRGTHFRVGVDDGDNAVFNEVLSGGVAVGTTKKPDTLIVPAGKGNIVSQQGVSKPVDLLAAPELTGNYKLQDRPTLVFTLEPRTEARAYRLQISSDMLAQNILMESRATENRFKFDGLADGNYFVRASAIDAAGLEGLPQLQAFTLKARPEPPFTVLPKAKLRAEKVDFVWTQAADAQAYHLQVAGDPTFQQPLIDQSDIKEVQFSTDRLSVAKYYWRVATIAQKNGQADQGPYSDVQVFNLMPVQNMNAPKDDGGNMLSFNWPSEPGQKFLIQIAHDAGFKSLFLSKELDQAELHIPRPDSGDYFIRVRATDADGYIGAFTATQKLTVYTRWVSSSGEPIQSGGAVVKPGF